VIGDRRFWGILASAFLFVCWIQPLEEATNGTRRRESLPTVVPEPICQEAHPRYYFKAAKTAHSDVLRREFPLPETLHDEWRSPALPPPPPLPFVPQDDGGWQRDSLGKDDNAALARPPNHDQRRG
jgi:hypothetical protein